MIMLTAAVVKCNDIHLSIVNMVHMHSNDIHGKFMVLPYIFALPM